MFASHRLELFGLFYIYADASKFRSSFWIDKCHGRNASPFELDSQKRLLFARSTNGTLAFRYTMDDIDG